MVETFAAGCKRIWHGFSRHNHSHRNDNPHKSHRRNSRKDNQHNRSCSLHNLSNRMDWRLQDTLQDTPQDIQPHNEHPHRLRSLLLLQLQHLQLNQLFRQLQHWESLVLRQIWWDIPGNTGDQGCETLLETRAHLPRLCGFANDLKWCFLLKLFSRLMIRRWCECRRED